MVLEMEMSKTYQYRKVMKPLLERKRRARINKCLDELKDLMVECLTHEGEHVTRLEKADILELTVEHLRKLKNRKQQSVTDSFRSGYIQAANEVSKALASTPGVDITLGTRLMTHLGHRLNNIQSTIFAPPPTRMQQYPRTSTPSTPPTSPLTVVCDDMCTSPMSPASSGYGSESEGHDHALRSGLLKIAQSPKETMWRPW